MIQRIPFQISDLNPFRTQPPATPPLSGVHASATGSPGITSTSDHYVGPETTRSVPAPAAPSVPAKTGGKIKKSRMSKVEEQAHMPEPADKIFEKFQIVKSAHDSLDEARKTYEKLGREDVMDDKYYCRHRQSKFRPELQRAEDGVSIQRGLIERLIQSDFKAFIQRKDEKLLANSAALISESQKLLPIFTALQIYVEVICRLSHCTRDDERTIQQLIRDFTKNARASLAKTDVNTDHIFRNNSPEIVHLRKKVIFHDRTTALTLAYLNDLLNRLAESRRAET